MFKMEQDIEARIKTLQTELKKLKAQRPSWLTKKTFLVREKCTDFRNYASSRARHYATSCVENTFLCTALFLIGTPFLIYKGVRNYVVPNLPFVPAVKRADILIDRTFHEWGSDSPFYEDEPRRDLIECSLKVYREDLKEARRVSRLANRAVRLYERTSNQQELGWARRRRDNAQQYVDRYGPVINSVLRAA
jgi:hypothetical protein